MEKATRQYSLPYEFIVSAINEFRESDFKHEWIGKTKLLKEISVKAIISCRMTTDFFSATLTLQQKGETIYEKEILHTLPDEIMFATDLNDIVYQNHKISVLSRFDETTFSLRWPISNKK
jgi:hypothetical protein